MALGGVLLGSHENLGGGGFMFTPGEDSYFDDHIFPMGWEKPPAR